MVAIEFEHFLGFNSNSTSVCFHPNGRNYVYSSGGYVVIADLTDPHAQTFLKGHDDLVTCLALSPSGKFVVSGQKGTNANVIVWEFESRIVVYSLEEHDFCVQGVAFSEDEKILATIGNEEDVKFLNCAIAASSKNRGVERNYCIHSHSSCDNAAYNFLCTNIYYNVVPGRSGPKDSFMIR